jgi:hypothetical protein
VATVAALTLQQRGRRVSHLTILDSPESELTLEGNAANLLGFYLEQMQIENPSYACASGAFVDNYASCFGVAYKGAPGLDNIVEVALQPTKLYGTFDYSDQHGYCVAWYGGAAAGAAAQGEPPLGPAWPPPPSNYLPALNQKWPTGINQASQWQLQPGPSIHDSFAYSTQPLTLRTVYPTQGNVQGHPSTKLIFGAASGTWPAYSIYHGNYYNPPLGDNYGIAFDVVWTAPQAGDYLVVTMEAPETRIQETLLVMDGQSYPRGRTSVAINCDVSSLLSLDMHIYYLAARGNSIGQVALSNFRFVVVESASGYLRARRLAAVAEKTAQRGLTAPQRK